MVKPKISSSSSRAADGSGFAFGAQSFGGGFATALSPFSYLAEIPDISKISDPQTVVVFKNLVKRDATTRSRALEELQSSLNVTLDSKLEVENAILETWIALYPRISIDSTRRIRLLAQSIQGTIAKAVGKGLAKHLAVIVGPWLLACHDTDQGVANAAKDSLSSVFAADKVDALRRAYQSQILQTCADIIQKESSKSLSDERIVNVDEAVAKYDRVLAASLGILASTLENLSAEDRSKLRVQYTDLISDSNTWRFAASKDASVRRAMNRLLRVTLEQSDLISSLEASLLSTAYVERSLKTDQTGTANDLVKTLKFLTQHSPTPWSLDWKGKKSAATRVREFLKAGSQGAPAGYWQEVATLLSSIPAATYPSASTEAMQMIEAFELGFSGRTELKTSLPSATRALFSAVPSITANLTDAVEYEQTLNKTIVPLIESFILPRDGKWAMDVGSLEALLEAALDIRGLASLLSEQWTRITNELVDMLRKSIPETSKDYVACQDRVRESGLRWTLVFQSLLRESHADERLHQNLGVLLRESLNVCKARNGKPYGATVVSQVILKYVSDIVWQDATCAKDLDDFVQHFLPKLVVSPSNIALCRILQASSQRPYFRNVWKSCLLSIETEDIQKNSTQSALAAVLEVAKQTDTTLLDAPEVYSLVNRMVDSSLEYTDWSNVARVLESLPEEKTISILSRLTASFSQQSATVLPIAKLVAIQSPSVIERFTASQDGQKLLSSLLVHAETHDNDASSDARELQHLLGKLAIGAQQDGTGENGVRIADVIRKGLTDVTPDAIPVQTLSAQAINILSNDSISLDNLLPDPATWRSELLPFLQIAPPFATDVLSSVPGIGFLVDQNESQETSVVARDAQGLSVMMRMAIYTVSLLENNDLFQAHSPVAIQIVQLLTLTMLVVNYRISYPFGDALLLVDASDDISYAEFVASCQRLIQTWTTNAGLWWVSNEQSDYQALGLCLDDLLQAISGSSSEAFYASRAYETLLSQLVSRHGMPPARISELSATASNLQRSDEHSRASWFLSSIQDVLSNMPMAKSWYNAAIAAATGLDYRDPKRALQKLVNLSAFLTVKDEPFITSAAHQRMVFLFRDTIKGLESTASDAAIQSMLLSTLSKLSEPLKEVYGDYWATAISHIAELWQNCPTLVVTDPRSAHLNRIFESQRLYRAFRRIAKSDDCNEDLTEALAAASSALNSGLLHLFTLDVDISDENNQPLRMVRDFVANELRQSSDVVFDPEDLYPVIYASNEDLQLCAFKLLHDKLPQMQAQISLDVVIEKRSATIADALLSLTLEAPRDVDINDSEDLRSQLAIRRYLCAWMLVFDHFDGSSHQLQGMYLDNIKSSGDLGALLDFIYTALNQAKLLTAKTLPYDIVNFDIGLVDGPRQEILWASCHLYYLSLVHTSSLAKDWWLNAHRTVSQNMEAWTERHITPHVISTAFSAIERWSRDQESSASPEDRSLTIKANKSSREVIASLPVGSEDDERAVSICVSLPPTFPLQAASVLSRDAATSTPTFEARKWHAWLMIAQGAIKFNNNSIPDGLLAWRRNVAGALAGKSECTICYSLVSEDGKLPNKECKTCRHAFHMLCLTKWFASSGDKKCPLCRSDFTGLGRVDRSGRRSTRED